MNDLHEEFESKGLSVVGVTGETAENTEPWIEEHGVSYAYAYLTKAQISGFMKQLGMRGYPSAALVDAKGTVVWSGSPYDVDGGLIKKHLAGADRTPVSVRSVAKGWPEDTVAIKKAIAKGQLAKALAAARRRPAGQDGTNRIEADVQRFIERKAARVTKIHERGDYLRFLETARDVKKPLSGLPEGDEIAKLVKSVKRDKAARAVMKAQRQIAKLGDESARIRKREDLDELVGKLEKLAGAHDGTYAAASAKRLIAKLAKTRKRLTR